MAVVPSVVSRYGRVAQQARRGGREARDGVVCKSGLEQPVQQLAPAVASWKPRTATHRQRDGSARLEELVCDLAARLPAAYDQDATAGQLLGTPVLARVELEDSGRQLTRQLARGGALIGARRDDDVVGFERDVMRLDSEAAPDAAYTGDLDARADGRVDRCAVVLEVPDHLGERRERVRLAARVVEAG
jgi:hypothetical protein